jgi:hypothetical protein
MELQTPDMILQRENNTPKNDIKTFEYRKGSLLNPLLVNKQAGK